MNPNQSSSPCDQDKRDKWLEGKLQKDGSRYDNQIFVGSDCTIEDVKRWLRDALNIGA